MNRTEPDHYELGFVSVAAARKNSTVSYFRSEGVDGGFIVTGAEITGTITHGPRKGKARYSKDTVRVIVTKAEVDAECDRYESETGRCSNCLGTGQQFDGWAIKTGARFKTCERCGGNGAELVAPDKLGPNPLADAIPDGHEVRDDDGWTVGDDGTASFRGLVMAWLGSGRCLAVPEGKGTTRIPLSVVRKMLAVAP